jgi:hypothetical protein
LTPAQTYRILKIMPTMSFHAPAVVAKRIRAASKKQGVPVSNFLRTAAEEALKRENASFGVWAEKFAGIVRSGKRDLSQREGFGP